IRADNIHIKKNTISNLGVFRIAICSSNKVPSKFTLLRCSKSNNNATIAKVEKSKIYSNFFKYFHHHFLPKLYQKERRKNARISNFEK
ncbi:hypothetical protein DRZ84_15260, partial [Enterococcus faecium]